MWVNDASVERTDAANRYCYTPAGSGGLGSGFAEGTGVATALGDSRGRRQMAATVASFAIADIAFRFWLFYPGFFQFSDWMAVTLPGSVDWQYASHGQVLFISFALKVLYRFFGYHTWYILLLNLALWHAGLAAIVFAVYRATSNRHALWLLLLTFWPGVWFYLALYWKDFTFGLFLWLASGMYLLATTFGPVRSTSEKSRRRVFWVVVVVVLLCALYWRHNAIVTVAPVCLYLAHRVVVAKGGRAFGASAYLARLASIFAALSVCLVVLVMEHAALLGKPGQQGKTRHIFLHDLVGISVITGHDLIPESAYRPGVTFADVEHRYAVSPANVDRFVYGPNRLLDETGPDRLTPVWADSIRRYPMAYLRHKTQFATSLVTTRPWLPTAHELEADLRISWSDRAWFTAYIHDVMARFPLGERKITFTPARLAVCARVRKWTQAANPRPVVYLGLSVLGLVLGTTWLVRDVKQRACPPPCDRVVLSQCLFLAAVATFAAIIGFAPHGNYRYIFPAVTTSIPATIALALGLRGSRRNAE